MFLVDLPDPAIRIERVLDTIDSSMPGGHAIIAIDNLRVPADQMLGERRGLQIRAGAALPRPALALHALARRGDRGRKKSPANTR
jgi:alkylation response protein AidB-like acyl-CoA dehydrogenase